MSLLRTIFKLRRNSKQYQFYAIWKTNIKQNTSMNPLQNRFLDQPLTEKNLPAVLKLLCSSLHTHIRSLSLSLFFSSQILLGLINKWITIYIYVYWCLGPPVITQYIWHNLLTTPLYNKKLVNNSFLCSIFLSDTDIS